MLKTLRTQPLLGRVFRDDEDRTGAPKVALLSEGFWRRRFNADPNIIGKTVRLNDEQHTIIGVLAAGTEPPGEYRGSPGEIWTPFGSAYTAQQWTERGRHNWMVIARLRPGVTLAQADAEMKSIGASLAREYPDTNAKVGAFVAPLRDHFVGSGRRMLLILLGTVVFVLLIACSNLANLLLSRAASRAKEVAVRAALGAGTGRLIRQFLCESLLLCVAGSAAGLAAGNHDLRLLRPSRTGRHYRAESAFHRLASARLHGRYHSAHSGSVRPGPAGAATETRPEPFTKPERPYHGCRDRIPTDPVAAHLHRGLPGVPAADRRGTADPDVHESTRRRSRPPHPNLLTLRMPPSQARTFPRITALQSEMLRRIRAIPGVEAAGFTNHIPIAFKGDVNGVGAEGYDRAVQFQCNSRAIGPGYLKAMGIPIVRGRDIQETDVEGAPFVLLINETLARTLWPGQDPIGRRLLFGDRYSSTGGGCRP